MHWNSSEVSNQEDIGCKDRRLEFIQLIELSSQLSVLDHKGIQEW